MTAKKGPSGMLEQLVRLTLPEPLLCRALCLLCFPPLPTLGVCV